MAVIHTLAEVPGSRPLLQHNATQASAAELFEGGSLADVAAAASAASPQQVRMCYAQTLSSYHAPIRMVSRSCMYLDRVIVAACILIGSFRDHKGLLEGARGTARCGGGTITSSAQLKNGRPLCTCMCTSTNLFVRKATCMPGEAPSRGAPQHCVGDAASAWAVGVSAGTPACPTVWAPQRACVPRHLCLGRRPAGR